MDSSGSKQKLILANAIMNFRFP